MVSVEEAQAAIENALEILPSQLVPLSAAHGRVLRADVHALSDMPAFAASLKDGYALRVCDIDGAFDGRGGLKVREDLASHASSSDESQLPAALGPGQAAYVATGAPIPPGSDAVVMIEVCTVDSGTVRIKTWPKAGADIRLAGSDAKKGEVLLRAGAVLRAGELGLLAGAGIRQVEVTRIVKVGVLSSGDELYDAAVDDPLPRGGVRDSNRPMLLALISEHLGGFAQGIDIGVVRDEKDTVWNALEGARNQHKCDVLITTGGVSMGEKDFIKPTLKQTGNIHFGRVNMKPGKPLTFASYHKHQCIVALPGNPVSAFVCFHVAAARAVRKLAGLPSNHMQMVQATLTHDFKRDRIRPEFHRVELTVSTAQS